RIAKPQVAAHHADLALWPKRTSQQSEGVKLLQPLTVFDVGLAARKIFGVAGVDQQNLKSVSLQNLKQWNPINTRGLHGDGLDLAALQPLTERDQIAGKDSETAHRIFVPILWHRDP